MHRQKCYNTCRRYFGKVVRIEDRNGYIHLGKITDVTKDSVWIEPIHRPSFDTGFGYYDAYANGGCDFCGGLRQCNRCGFGFGGGRGGCGGCGNCSGCGFGGYGYGGGGYGLAFGFIFGITLAALFFI
ncbi:hypothetical protein [Bacillus gaemokensis]|uniref:Uncharacterized protein n=1 Tax=Bacillus gaemokensis TaxID=574375 RepID=A0A073K6U1_9BACI|nr:hypothetical protein [Bacillus gaemokensis]KEK22266.1 hypothetical protein BAGA_20455 [Bacillus gaemokensis]KYG28754.1 hypothetical protein AZF08_13595 [Bacillus gaemokensis]